MWNKFLRNQLHIVKDYELRKLLWQSGGGTAVCKKYLKFRDIAPEKLTFPETQVDEPIWLFWNTGLEQAPEIVRTCYQSVKKYAGRQVVLLTENNVQNYINMPDYLLNHHRLIIVQYLATFDSIRTQYIAPDKVPHYILVQLH